MLVDSHCHLDRLDVTAYPNGLCDVIEEARQQQVSQILCVGINMQNAHQVVQIAQTYSDVYCSIGLHPLDIEPELPDMQQLIQLCQQEKVVAVGETGLDYFYAKETAQQQQHSFRLQMEVATQVNKPVIIHTREAQQDTLDILREYRAERIGGVFHCFTENWDMAKQGLDMGFYISISGIVTFRNAENVREVAKKIPSDRLLVETDAPYLTPVPFRGKPNYPKHVVQVAKFLADLRGESFEQFCAATTQNFQTLFRV